MLTEGHGSLLEAPADALVNTINTVGIMGKGLALQFKQAYPGNFRATREAAGGSTDPGVLSGLIGQWNKREGRLFTEAHIGKAIARLEDLGWVRK
jgi:hypothetical protein